MTKRRRSAGATSASPLGSAVLPKSRFDRYFERLLLAIERRCWPLVYVLLGHESGRALHRPVGDGDDSAIVIAGHNLDRGLIVDFLGSKALLHITDNSRHATLLLVTRSAQVSLFIGIHRNRMLISRRHQLVS